MPLRTSIFWTSLAVIDPLIAVLLFIRPRAASFALLLLMLTDTIHKPWMIICYGAKTWMVLDQWLFLIFVIPTMRIVWREASIP